MWRASCLGRASRRKQGGALCWWWRRWSSASEDHFLFRFAATKAQDLGAKGFSFVEVPELLADLWRVSSHRPDVPLQLLLRPCYPVLFDLMWKHNTRMGRRPGVVFLGNPGIGKTGFLWYMLWRLLQKQVPILLKVPVRSKYTYVNWHQGRFFTEDLPSCPEMLVPGCWYLADQFIPQTDWAWRYRFILTCSPLKCNNYHEFSKGQDVMKLYVPTWTDEELFALNEQQFGHPSNDVKDRIMSWGGIPRYVLGKVDNASQSELKMSAGLVRNVDMILKLDGLPEDQSHKVFHMQVDETSFTEFHLKFASDKVEEMVYSNLTPSQLCKFIQNRQNEFIRDIQGKIFEHYICDTVVPKGAKFKYRTLEESGAFSLKVETDVMTPMPGKIKLACTGGGGHKAVFPENVLEEHKDYLFLPTSARNAEWDLIVYGSVYQVTVSEDRDLQIGEALVKAVEFLSKWHKKIAFCFLVPEHLLLSFKIDWFGSVEKKKESKAVVEKEEQAGLDTGSEGSTRKESKAEKKAQIIAEKMKKLKELGVTVKVVSFEVANLCPKCKGAGVIDGGSFSQAMESVIEMLPRKGLADKKNPGISLEHTVLP